MKQEIGALCDQVAAVIFDRGDHGLDRLLAKFLGAVLRALVEELPGVGRLSARRRAGIDGGGQIMKGETRHQLELKPRARTSGRHPAVHLASL